MSGQDNNEAPRRVPNFTNRRQGRTAAEVSDALRAQAAAAETDRRTGGTITPQNSREMENRSLDANGRPLQEGGRITRTLNEEDFRTTGEKPPSEKNDPRVVRVDNQRGENPSPKVVRVDNSRSNAFRVDNDGYQEDDGPVVLEGFPVPEGGAGGTRGRAGPRVVAEGPNEEMVRAIRERLKGKHIRDAVAAGVVPGAGSRPGRVPGTLVSRETMEQYLQRGRMLYSRWRLAMGIRLESDEDADPVAFVNWLLSLKPSSAASTWRMYRQAGLHWLDGFPGYGTMEARIMLEDDVAEAVHPDEIERRRKASKEGGGKRGRAATRLAKANAAKSGGGEDDPSHDGEGHEVEVDDEDNEEPGDRTSALKEKRLPEDALEKLRSRLRVGTRSRLSEAVADWLEAGILTGLRPSEWSSSDLHVQEVPRSEAHPNGKMVLLYVVNAKATNGRGTGVARTLDLSGFNEADISTVRRHSLRCRTWLEEGRFADLRGQCANLLRKQVAAVWPGRDGGIAEGRHYSMYSCRHQAIANWKSLDLPLEEIAAVVGHAVTATTTERYGKRRSAWKPDRIPLPPRGIPEEITLVRNRMNMFRERMKQSRELGIKVAGPTDFPA